ncbi:MAG: glycerol-3-phosphate acyltransferase [Lachnospiraceae bacterium]|nr:glycerol-3-phosphate acyltransferase [Lachnospiraceae bacterium]
MTWVLACGVIGYLVGTINPSYFIAKIKGFDIRGRGSGNAGGSNALITMGNKIGAICMILDILKSYLVVTAIMYFLPGNKHAAIVAGVMCIIGHMFPFYMGFKCGKGFACLGGLILAYSSKLFVIMLAAVFILVLVTDYICVGHMAASVAFAIIYGIYENDVMGFAILMVGAGLIIYKHIENIKRIREGREVHFSFLWRKDEETQRVQKNMEEK